MNKDNKKELTTIDKAVIRAQILVNQRNQLIGKKNQLSSELSKIEQDILVLEGRVIEVQDMIGIMKGDIEEPDYAKYIKPDAQANKAVAPADKKQVKPETKMVKVEK